VTPTSLPVPVARIAIEGLSDLKIILLIILLIIVVQQDIYQNSDAHHQEQSLRGRSPWSLDLLEEGASPGPGETIPELPEEELGPEGRWQAVGVHRRHLGSSVASRPAMDWGVGAPAATPAAVYA